MTIISHRHRFVFIAIPKVASHSLRFALREHLGPEDEEQVALFVNKRIDRPEFASSTHGHQLAREVRAALGEAQWASLLSFAVVRNPWDRFVSYVAFMMRHNGLFERDPQAAMRRVLSNPQNQSAVHFRSQLDFVTDEAGRLIVSRLLKVEQLQVDFDRLCDELGLPHTRLEVRNASTHRPYTDYYDASLIEAVAERYRLDIQAFGYRFGGSDSRTNAGTAG